jgi:hypothetical protein
MCFIFSETFFALTSFMKFVTRNSDICQDDKLFRHFQQKPMLGLMRIYVCVLAVYDTHRSISPAVCRDNIICTRHILVFKCVHKTFQLPIYFNYVYEQAVSNIKKNRSARYVLIGSAMSTVLKIIFSKQDS